MKPVAQQVIEIDGSSAAEEGSDGIKVILDVGPALLARVKKHQKEATGIRLTTKPTPSLSLTAKSNEWVGKKKAAYKAASDPAKNAPITFKCDLFLHNRNGRKSGTRAPMQSRAFQQSEVVISIIDINNTYSHPIRKSIQSLQSLSTCLTRPMEYGVNYFRAGPFAGTFTNRHCVNSTFY